MSCAYCERAKTELWFGGVIATCRGCVIRDLAKCPPAIREAEYRRVEGEERARLVAEVNAERKRLGALQRAGK